MKIDTESLYIVMQSHPKVTDFEELFFDAERNLADLNDLFSGGIGAEDIYGIYTDRKSALKDALNLWEQITSAKNDPMENNKKIRFQQFVGELEKLSNKYNVAIDSIGGVYIFDEPMEINYDPDETSGDLVSSWREPL
ncbi:hypothetical protein [Aquimarina algiphila]|uniref:hypothetical protein n=1 Tax=Aquimarina algiphila TaxID=2047982 RepID=UPI00232A9F8C|nr:hypothetical protein [Aquimarina algiphila]